MSYVLGLEAPSSLSFYSYVLTLGIDHIDNGCAVLEFDLQCSGVPTLYEKLSYLQ